MNNTTVKAQHDDTIDVGVDINDDVRLEVSDNVCFLTCEQAEDLREVLRHAIDDALAAKEKLKTSNGKHMTVSCAPGGPRKKVVLAIEDMCALLDGEQAALLIAALREKLT